ncbi:MAG: DUF3343 domain-containing protein [Candidatus Cloacimonadales bacterium]|jgi:hypothetical protein|nr:DUF3343 domain-containing protein [Candidatus Cloacimonadota bacterium]MDD2650401.1 DUF3343 domain-containing protein [Candidatus Cloacimonadota bacterium]MDX9977935.1 DUF3343 domain-containing protein [Candidatus Cloacimonadales bacterium]
MRKEIDDMIKIFSFKSVHAAIKADDLFAKQSLEYKIITTPEYISSDCGMSIEFKALFIKEFCKILDDNNVKYVLNDKRE